MSDPQHDDMTDENDDFDLIAETEAMRKIAFKIAVQIMDASRAELEREVKRARWWTRLLIVCVALNLGAAALNLLL